MVRVTGVEWKRFYADAGFWPDGAWHENERITVDGEEPGEDFDPSSVPDMAMIAVWGGTVFLNETARDGPSLEAHLKRWRKRQATTVLVVETPNEAADAVRAAIAAAGGKVRA